MQQQPADTLLADITASAVTPALQLLPQAMDSAIARHLLLAIMLQESEGTARRQFGNGPARSLWQFEPGSKQLGGGVWGVYKHKASRYWLNQLCEARGCPFEPQAIWARIETDDVLAAGLARLLLFTDAKPLPTRGQVDAAWQLYARRTWVPGKPKPEKWPGNYARAARFIWSAA